jgi:PAS domain-containing protein
LPYAQVRTAIDTVFTEGGSLTVSPVELALSAGGNGHIHSLTVTLLPDEVGSTLRVVLYFNDITEHILFKQAHLKQAQLLDNLLSTNSDLTTENAQLVKANQQLREASQAVITTYEQLQERLAEEQLATEELMTVQEEFQVVLEEGEQTREQLSQQCVEYRWQLAALQVIVNQEVRQSLAVYDIETATLLISSLGFREVVAAIHGRSHIDLTGSIWQELFMGNNDQEARHAWQTALQSQQSQHFNYRSREIISRAEQHWWEWTLTPILEEEEQVKVRFLLATVIEQTDKPENLDLKQGSPSSF